jgi:hypothetical protein
VIVVFQGCIYLSIHVCPAKHLVLHAVDLQQVVQHVRMGYMYRRRSVLEAVVQDITLIILRAAVLSVLQDA